MGMMVFGASKLGGLLASLIVTLVSDPSGTGGAALTAPKPAVAQCAMPAASLAFARTPAAGGGQMMVQLGAPRHAAASVNTLVRASDGLFYVDAQVNGTSVRFLVDTGASTTVLTRDDAERAGVLPVAERFDQTAETAGGRTRMARIQLAQLDVAGSMSRNVPAAVASAGLNVSLLGQDWLSRLDSVLISGNRMILQ